MIVLGQYLSADAVLVDDQRAVVFARTCGLVVRTPTMYVVARRRGLIKSVRRKLDQLRSAGFRLKEADYNAVLRVAGEL